MIKMKRLRTLLAMVMLAMLNVVLSSCPDDGNDKDEAMLEVSPENISLDSNGEGTLSISTNGMWSVSTGAEWLTFSTMSGVGSSSITIRTIGNSTSDRTAIVTIKCESISRQVVVTQIGTPATPTGPQDPTNPSKQTYNVAGVSFNMVRVDGGTSWMGATAEQVDDADSDEKPVHQVTLNAYYIGETEVTQELWNVVMGSNPSSFNGNKRPVERVSWNDCQDFIAKLNQMTGQKFRLPTEAEWEFAARGGTKSQGYKYAGSNTIGDVAWYSGNSNETTHDVGTKQANELGIYDMSGNVFEWCQDWFDDYSSNAQTSPSGPSTGSNRVRRGGSWSLNARYCRVSRRRSSTPAATSYNWGLRLALQ